LTIRKNKYTLTLKNQSAKISAIYRLVSQNPKYSLKKGSCFSFLAGFRKFGIAGNKKMFPADYTDKTLI